MGFRKLLSIQFVPIFCLVLIACCNGVCSPPPGLFWSWNNTGGLASQGKLDVHGKIRARKGVVASAYFDGGSYIQVPGLGIDKLPRKAFTVEILARIDKPLTWGCLAGFFQDNGSFEKGWIAGYNENHLYFALSSGKKLSYMNSVTVYRKRRWFHLVGSYDGSVMKIYVNGNLEAVSTSQSGPVDYPANTVFTIGSYHDADENFPHTGSISFVNLYNRVLNAGEVKSLSEGYESLFTVKRIFAVGPYLSFKSRSEAIVECEASFPCSARLCYGPVPEETRQSPSVELDDSYSSRLKNVIEGRAEKKSHSFLLKGLEYRQMYGYRIILTAGGKEFPGPVYAVDNSLNYNCPGPGIISDEKPGSAELLFAEAVLRETNFNKGYCIVCGNPKAGLLKHLASRSGFSVIGVDKSGEKIGKTRRALYRAGLYGKRIKVRAVADYSELPFPSKFANLVIVRDLQREKNQDALVKEILRILRPAGGTCLIECNTSDLKNRAKINLDSEIVSAIAQQLESIVDTKQFSVEVLLRGKKFSLVKITRSALKGGGTWTHEYGDPGNSSNSNGSLSGKTSTHEMQVQWLGNPEGDFGLDRNPRMPSPLGIHGRLFHQGMNRIAGIDSYNGSILWSDEIPDLRRVNIPHDSSNWCADDLSLYVAVKDRLWIMDQLTGKLEKTVSLPVNRKAYNFDWGFVAQAGEMFYGSSVKKESAYTGYWGGGSWYDGRSGSGTYKVVSDELYGFRKQDSKIVWRYGDGSIINSAIGISGGYVFAAGSNSKSLEKLVSGRISSPDLWKEMFLVCLDRKTGERVWKKKIDSAPGVVVYFLQCSKDQVIIESSASGKYHLYVYDKKDGSKLWHTEHKWTGTSHSGHMQHGVVVGETIFLEPFGYDLRTGKRVTSNMGRHEGCATYCGTMDALIYRGKGRKISMWGIENEQVTSWTNLRPSCWLSTVTADGMVLSPEGGGGCSCGNWLETSVVFSPREPGDTSSHEKD